MKNVQENNRDRKMLSECIDFMNNLAKENDRLREENTKLKSDNDRKEKIINAQADTIKKLANE